MNTRPSFSRLLPGIFLVLGFLAPGMGALAPTTVSAAGPSVSKPVPGPMTPIPASRPLVHGGSLHGATTPGRSGGPKVLIHPTTAQLLGHGQKPARPALGGPGLPAHGRLIHAQPASPVKNRGYWNGSHYVAPASGPVEHPLLPPPPSHGHGTTTRPRYPSAFDASTQVDNNPNASFCGFGANESSVAQSTDNPNNVVDAAQMYMNGDGSCGDSHPFAFYSHDGGQHWQQVIMPGLSLQAGGDTSVVYDPLHHVFVLAFIQFDRTDNSGQINVEVSSDGSSWGLLTSLDTTDGSVYTNDKAMITVDQNPSSPHYGRVAVSWTEFPNAGGMFLYDAVSDDGGNSWTGSTTSINYSNSNCGNGSSPAFDVNGDLMVAWDSCAGAPTPLSGSGYSLEEELSSDGGINWTAPSDTVITGITDIGYRHSCLLGSTSFRCNSFPSLAGDPNPSDEGGTAFVIVWANEDNGITDSRFPNQSASISEIHGLISLNGGASWSGPTGFGFAFISFADFGDKFFPWIAFAPDGRMNVGYSDREDDASSGNPSGTSYDEYGTEAGSLASFVGDAYVAYTDDGTLGNPGSSTFIGDYAGITSQDNNFDTFPTWTDNRSGVNNDVRTMDLCFIDCYTFLAPYSPISAGSSSFTDLYQFNMDPSFGGSGSNYWNAVGIREGTDGTSVDDDMALYGDRYYSNLLTYSNASPPNNDYLLVNGNVAANQPYFPLVHSFSSLGGPYTIEWAAGSSIVFNGTGFADSMGNSSVIRVYDTYLSSGTLYDVGIRPGAGNSSDLSLQLHSASQGTEQGYGNNVSTSGRAGAGNPAFSSYNTGTDPSQYDGIVVQNNNGGAGSYTVYEDTVVPTGTVNINGGAPYTNTTAVTLTLSASNANAGDPVMDMRFSNDGITWGNWQSYATSAPYTLPSGDGTKTVFVEYRNGAGGISSASSASIKLDTTPPITTASLSGTATGCSGNYFSPVTVTLTAIDPAPGSGVASTFYQIDGGAVTTYTAPFPVSGVGSHTVTFHSTDHAGNVESTKSTSFTIVAPSISAAPTSGIVGSSTTITGSNFKSGESVKVFWDSTSGALLGTFTATGSCGLSGSVTVPHAAKGSHSVVAVGQTSGKQATTSFSVIPALTISPVFGHAGSAATVTLTGYGNSEGVTVKWNCASASCGSTTVLTTGTASSTGDFSHAVTIPTGQAANTYSVGGIGGSGSFAKASFTVVTFSNVSWTTGAVITRAHIEAGAAVSGGKVYVMDGGTTDLSDGGGNTASTNVDVYTPSSNTWASAASNATARNQNPMVAPVGSLIYLIGGTNSSGTVRPVETYNPTSNTWSTLPSTANLPTSLDGVSHCGAAVGTNIYYFEPSGIGVFSTTSKTWTVKTASSLLTPSAYCQAAAVGTTQIAITGPGDGSPDANSQRVLVYTISTNGMNKLSITTAQMAEHSFALVNGGGVVAGGDFSPTTSQVIAGNGTLVINGTALPSARDDQVTAVVSGKVYLLGGQSGTNTTPQVLIGTTAG